MTLVLHDTEQQVLETLGRLDYGQHHDIGDGVLPYGVVLNMVAQGYVRIHPVAVPDPNGIGPLIALTNAGRMVLQQQEEIESLCYEMSDRESRE